MASAGLKMTTNSIHACVENNTQPVIFTTPQGLSRVDAVTVATAAWQRAMGLMGQSSIGNGRGLLLAPCGSVHTFFMRFDLTQIFVSRDFRVVRVMPSVKPYRIALGGRLAWAVLELQAGWFPCDQLTPGTLMSF